jgi:hypothetical protein
MIFDSNCTEILGFIMGVKGESHDSEDILEKPEVDDLLEKRPAFLGTRTFITVFQGSPNWFVS